MGNGIVVSGAFDAIDRSSGPYFIKTEIDPNGGINCSITGSSRIVSVPHALHTNAADSITGVINVFGSSIANGITATDIVNWNNSSTDGQNISGSGLSGTDLTIEIEGSSSETVDLSSIASADNLGNHTAAQNIQLGINYLSGDGDNEGIYVDVNGNVGIGTSSPTETMQVNGSIKIINSTEGAYKVLTSDANGVASWQSHQPVYLQLSTILLNSPAQQTQHQ